MHILVPFLPRCCARYLSLKFLPSSIRFNSSVRVDTLKVLLSETNLSPEQVISKVVALSNDFKLNKNISNNDLDDFELIFSHLDHFTVQLAQIEFDLLLYTLHLLDFYKAKRPTSQTDKIEPLYKALIANITAKILPLGNFAFAVKTLDRFRPALKAHLIAILNRVVRKNADKLLQDGVFKDYILLISHIINIRTVQALFHIHSNDGRFNLNSFVSGNPNCKVINKCLWALQKTGGATGDTKDIPTLLSGPFYPEDYPTLKNELLKLREALSEKSDLDSVVYLARVETLLYLFDISEPDKKQVERIVSGYFKAVSRNFKAAQLLTIIKLLLVTRADIDISQQLLNLPLKNINDEEIKLLHPLRHTKYGELIDIFLKRDEESGIIEDSTENLDYTLEDIEKFKLEGEASYERFDKLKSQAIGLFNTLFGKRWNGEAKSEIAQRISSALLSIYRTEAEIESVKPLPESDGLPRSLLLKMAGKYTSH